MKPSNELKSAESYTGARAEELLHKHLDEHPDPSGGTMLLDGGDSLVVTKRASGGMLLKEALPKPAKLKELAETRGIEWDDAQSPSRVIPYLASDERVDRHGDIVRQEWDFSDYELNPVMLKSHEWEGLPVGGVLDWAVGDVVDKLYRGPALKLTTVFATKETYDVADTVFRLAKAGFLKTGSVGFYPQDLLWIKDKAERVELGLGEDGLVFEKNSLIEWSPCSVPANPGAHMALTRAKALGQLKPGDAQVIREMTRLECLRSKQEERWTRDDAAMVRLFKHMFIDIKLPEAKDIEQPMEPSTEVAPTTRRGTPKPVERAVSLDDLGSSIDNMTNTLSKKLDSLGDILDTISTQLGDLVAEATDEEPDPAPEPKLPKPAKKPKPDEEPEPEASTKSASDMFDELLR